MTHKLFTLCFITILFSLTSLAQSIQQKEALNSQSFFNEEALLQHVKTLSSDSFKGRRTGTEGANKAKQYIINQFHLLNVEPLGIKHEQSFSFTSSGKIYNGVNVLGHIKGTTFPNKYIVISAHYDHLGIKNGKIYNGADDDASGISALFSFAEYFKKHPPKHSVILAAFDAEELGLKGSKYFVENSIILLDNIEVNINMDMIARSDKNELFVTGTQNNQSLKHIILSSEASGKVKLILGHDGSDKKQNWTYSSDHASFYTKNIPFLYFGVEDHNDYHQPTDDFDKINKEFYKDVVKTIISVFVIMDEYLK